MLVLTRRKGDRIVIDPETPDEIVIEVAHIGHGRVRIGIEAPDNRSVYRAELLTQSGAPPK